MTIVIIYVIDDNISPIVVLLVNVGVRHHGGRAEHRQLAAARPRVLVERQHWPVLECRVQILYYYLYLYLI